VVGASVVDPSLVITTPLVEAEVGPTDDEADSVVVRPSSEQESDATMVRIHRLSKGFLRCVNIHPGYRFVRVECHKSSGPCRAARVDATCGRGGPRADQPFGLAPEPRSKS